MTPSSDRGARATVSTAVFGAAQVASAALALVLLGILGRTLGRAGFGEYSFVFVVASFGCLIADFGMGPWISRAAAQEPQHSGRDLSSVLRLRSLTLLAAWIVTLGVTALWLRHAERVLEVAIMLVYVSALGYLIVYESYLLARGRAGRVAASVAGGKVLELGAVVAWLGTGGTTGVATITAVLAASALVRLLAVAFTSHRLARAESTLFGAAGDAPLPRRALLLAVLPFGVGVALGVVYAKVDVIVLERLSTPSSLGLYAAAYRILDALLLVPRSVLGVFYPLVAHAWTTDTLSPGVLSRPARALAALALAAAAGWWVLAGEVLQVVFGERFVPGAAASRILAFAVLPVFLNQYFSVVLNATHRQRAWLRVTAAALVINVLANLVLIPLLDLRGAAWATLLSESVSVGLFGALVARRHGWPLPLSWLARAVAAAIGMAALVHWVAIPFVPRVALGALAFLALAAVLGVVHREDWQLLRSAGRRMIGRGPMPPQEGLP